MFFFFQFTSIKLILKEGVKKRNPHILNIKLY